MASSEFQSVDSQSCDEQQPLSSMLRAERRREDEAVQAVNCCSRHVRPQQRRHHNSNGANTSNQTMLAFCTFVIASIISAQIPAVAGLACYETVNGKTTIVQNDSFTYCALVPATIVGNELVNGSQFGLGPDNDMMGAYNSAFAMSVDEYRILTVCIYERYDFSRFLTINPDLAVEFAFRCVCNYDLCNSEPTFSAYLSAIKSESFARR